MISELFQRDRDRQKTDMLMLTVAFRNNANAPKIHYNYMKKEMLFHTHSSWHNIYLKYVSMNLEADKIW